jgi:hypothetical protein
MSINSDKGKIRDPGLEAAIGDAEELRDQLQVGAENFSALGFTSRYTPTVWMN